MNLFLNNQLFFGDNLSLSYLVNLQNRLQTQPIIEGSTKTFFRDVVLYQGIAVIPVSGLIVKRSGLSLEEQERYGIYDLDLLNYQLSQLPGKASTALFWFDSNGGTETGLFDTWERINALSNYGIKTVGYSDTKALSAAYLLMSACDVAFVSDDAYAGSVGAIQQVSNYYDYNEEKGVHVHTFRSGKLKDRANPDIEWNPENDAFYQAKVQQAGDKFWEKANVKRTLVPEVKDAGVFIGNEALTAGLVDTIQRVELFS